MPGTTSTALGAAAAGALLLAAGCGSSHPGPTERFAPLPPRRIVLSSPDFRNGGALPRRFTCDGDGAAPALRWARVPDGTSELGLLVEDPDAPGPTFVHWVVLGISVEKHGLPTGVKQATLRLGRASSGKVGYEPPCPPAGPAHRYVFTLFALRRPLGQPYGARGAKVAAAMRRDALARGVLVGRYRRTG